MPAASPSSLFFVGVFEFELVHRPVTGTELRAFAVGAVAQLWGRLRGSDFRLALDSCTPLDKAVY